MAAQTLFDIALHVNDERWIGSSEFPNYLVSSKGRIYSKGRGVMMRPQNNPSGYLTVKLSDRGRHQTKRIHQLVAAAFLGDRPIGFVINYLDCNKTNNSFDNLEYTTIVGNTRHAFKNKLWVRKSAGNKNRKLSAAAIAEIIECKGWNPSLKSLAIKHGVSTRTVWGVRKKAGILPLIKSTPNIMRGEKKTPTQN